MADGLIADLRCPPCLGACLWAAKYRPQPGWGSGILAEFSSVTFPSSTAHSVHCPTLVCTDSQHSLSTHTAHTGAEPRGLQAPPRPERATDSMSTTHAAKPPPSLFGDISVVSVHCRTCDRLLNTVVCCLSLHDLGHFLIISNDEQWQ